MSNKRKVGIIFGGQSSEYEVSLQSSKNVLENIDRDKFDVVMIGISREGVWYEYTGEIENIPNDSWVTSSTKFSMDRFFSGEFDAVFPVMHGKNCEDGSLQGFFKIAGIPFVGAGVTSSAVGMDKAFSKLAFDYAGIPQCDYVVFNRSDVDLEIDDVIEKIEKKLGYPCFVKPANTGSSVGVSKAKDRTMLETAIETALKYDDKVLVEEFFDGREIESSVIGNGDIEVSMLGEIIPDNEFYDYESKYINDQYIAELPAKLSDEDTKSIRSMAVKAYRAIDCKGLARVDFFVHKETGKIVLNEINTLPGFTKISMYPRLWIAGGLEYKDLITKLIELAMEG